MLDIKLIREDTDFVKQHMAALQDPDAPVDKALALDEERRQLLMQVEELKARRNTESKRIGQLMREGKRDEANALKAEMGGLGDEIKVLDDRIRIIDEALFDAMSRSPNLPLPTVPGDRLAIKHREFGAAASPAILIHARRSQLSMMRRTNMNYIASDMTSAKCKEKFWIAACRLFLQSD